MLCTSKSKRARPVYRAPTAPSDDPFVIIETHSDAAYFAAPDDAEKSDRWYATQADAPKRETNDTRRIRPAYAIWPLLHPQWVARRQHCAGVVQREHYAFTFHDNSCLPAGDWNCIGELTWRIDGDHFVNHVRPLRTRSAEELAERAKKTAEHKANRAELYKRYSLAERIIDLRPLGSTKLQ